VGRILNLTQPQKNWARYIIADWKPILFLVQGSKRNIAGDYFIHYGRIKTS